MRSFLLRPYHYFISYSHKDEAFARPLLRWASETAGLRVWFDQQALRSGERVQADLAGNIGQCRGVIFLLSKHSLSSKFVQDELDQALAEKKEHRRFQIVLLRLDECDIAGQWKTIRQLKWHDLGTPDGPRLGLTQAAELLCRVHAFDGWQGRQGELKEVYVSRGWRETDERFADPICLRLAARALRLVGDLPDQGTTDLDRIGGILRGCWGHVVILPRRNSAGGADVAYKYFLQEVKLSERMGLPVSVFAPPGCELPAALAERATLVTEEALSGQAPEAAEPLDAAIYATVETLRKPTAEAHAFFASQYHGNEERNRLARQVVETTGTLPCYWGKEFRGMNVQGAIRDALTAARFVVADLTSTATDGPQAVSHPNVNASIEAAVAWGADVRLLCFAAENPAAGSSPTEGKTKHVPFMFRNAQIDLYADTVGCLAPGVEFLGAVHKAVLEDRKRYGRRIINYELDL